MNEKRRPPTLRPGPAPTQEPTPDPGIVTFTMTMTDRSFVAHQAPRESLDTMSENISEAIANGKTITLHDPSGQRTIVNTAHIVMVTVR